MKNFIFILSAFAIAALSACENNVDADLDNIEGVLCLNAYLRTNADTNFVYVSRTSRTNPKTVRDARVELRVNDNLVETVTDCYKITYSALLTSEQYDDDLGWINVEERQTKTDTVWGTYMLRSKFNVGDNVRVDVFSGDQHVWAEDIAPRKIEPPTVSYTYTHVSNNETGYSSKENDRVSLEISFNDVSADADYYRLAIRSDFYGVNAFVGYLYASDFDLNTKDEIIDYARKNLNPHVFRNETDTSIDVYYLSRNVFHRWQRYDDYGYSRCPILSEGESQSSKDDGESDFEFITGDVKNTYRVFSDKMFNGSTARLNVTDWAPYDVPDHENYPFQEFEIPELNDSVGSFYNWQLTLKLQTISEQQYYYLRALNAIESSAYDEMSGLSGAMKIPTNVHGGSGNFCVTTTTIVKVPILKNYRPPFYDTEPLYW